MWGRLVTCRPIGNRPPRARYVETNLVQAGLAADPEQYPWSSIRPIHNRPQVTNLPHTSIAVLNQVKLAAWNFVAARKEMNM
jgi:hypothetical protein